MTDISFTVGTIEIAQKAAIGYKSPVYLSFIKHRPSHHFPNPSGSLKYAFHFWDYISLVNINYLPFLNKENDDHPKWEYYFISFYNKEMVCCGQYRELDQIKKMADSTYHKYENRITRNNMI